jgi:isoleucyl-tRNA synthetase
MPRVPPDHQILKGCTHLNNFLVDTCKSSYIRRTQDILYKVKSVIHKKHAIDLIWFSVIHGLFVTLSSIDALDSAL